MNRFGNIVVFLEAHSVPYLLKVIGKLFDAIAHCSRQTKVRFAVEYVIATVVRFQRKVCYSLELIGLPKK